MDASEDKKAKLANSRKRFKELQELKKKRDESKGEPQSVQEDPNSAQSTSRNTPVSETAVPVYEPLKTHIIEQSDELQAAETSESVARSAIEEPATPVIQEQHNASLENYFGAAAAPSPAEFFDNISPSQETLYFNTDRDDPTQSDSENIGLPRYFDNINSSDAIWENTSSTAGVNDYKLFPNPNDNKLNMGIPIESDSVSLDYPEIQQHDMGEFARKNVGGSIGNSGMEHNGQHMLASVFSASDNQKLMDYLGTTGASEREKNEIRHINNEIDNSTDLTQREIQHSHNVESLRQLSDHLTQMIEPNYDYSSSGSITDLEKRNIELAAALEREKINSEQLRQMNNQLQAKIANLETEYTKQEISNEFETQQEIVRLRSELQTHLQTIGLLVAEKTELASNLSQYELNFKQKIMESEELQARLKASRSRVADLEREVNNLKTGKAKMETLEGEYGSALQNLRQEYQVLKEQRDELAQDLIEVREKLKNTMEENVQLQQQLKEITGKFSLAEVKIQQLSSGGVGTVDSQVEQLTQQKFALEGDIANLNQMLKSVIKERDESTIQFQQYAQQLNAQISNLSSKQEELQQENENLRVQEQNRIKHIGDLERQLQSLQTDQVNYISRGVSNVDLKNEVESFREKCEQLQAQKTQAEENYTKVSNEKDLLLKELEAKTDSISQLESMIEQLKGNQPDSVKLLATMESDKVAASMAIQQNRELKQQLEGMQEVVMKMDNDKVVLTENLKAQQQTNKDLMEKLQKTELTLQSLADAIEIKDKELIHLRDNSEELNRRVVEQELMEDRLRHYEAPGNSSEYLQRELFNAKETIDKLRNELDQLKKTAEEKNDFTKQNGNLEETISKEGDDATVKTEEAIKENVMHNEKQQNVDAGADKNMLNQENVMKCLEEKVKRTMQEIADLTDEKQRLEHIVLQLQGETETIGEYVALYQHQRMVLKQKALEKDQQLKQLANDREQIKIKLDRLNALIKRLVTEKGTVPPELLEHHAGLSNDNLCAEHTKMSEDLSKMAQSNVIEPDDPGKGDKVAEEIITLLSEIKSSNLVQPDENYHHCRWCSGQLMTV
ncbi:golgin subfamily A member 2 [Anthonomus grandis grandis]|uniref:golgin subfamily A member 2 n=1 Tax=Anthonomus grandis grandis TaxID=2921223 RepID=UPI0021663A40|nr:golgin subfamily A member 2 [Anthonomus grandis grandis]